MMFTDIKCPIGCYESFLVRNLILAPALSLTSFSTSCRRKTIAKKEKKNWDHSSFETPALEIKTVILGTCNAFALDWNLFFLHAVSICSLSQARAWPGSDFSLVNYKIISVTMENSVDQKVSEDLASQ